MNTEHMADFNVTTLQKGLSLKEMEVFQRFLRTMIATGVLVVLSLTVLNAQKGYDLFLNVKSQLETQTTSMIVLNSANEVWMITKKGEKLLFLQQKTGETEKVFEIGFIEANESNKIMVYEHENEDTIASREPFGDEELKVLKMAELAFKKKERPTFQL